MPSGLVDQSKYQDARDCARAAVAPVKSHAPTPLSMPAGTGAAGGGTAGRRDGGDACAGAGEVALRAGPAVVVTGRARAAAGTTGVGRPDAACATATAPPATHAVAAIVTTMIFGWRVAAALGRTRRWCSAEPRGRPAARADAECRGRAAPAPGRPDGWDWAGRGDTAGCEDTAGCSWPAGPDGLPGPAVPLCSSAR